MDCLSEYVQDMQNHKIKTPHVISDLQYAIFDHVVITIITSVVSYFVNNYPATSYALFSINILPFQELLSNSVTEN